MKFKENLLSVQKYNRPKGYNTSWHHGRPIISRPEKSRPSHPYGTGSFRWGPSNLTHHTPMVPGVSDGNHQIYHITPLWYREFQVGTIKSRTSHTYGTECFQLFECGMNSFAV